MKFRIFAPASLAALLLAGIPLAAQPAFQPAPPEPPEPPFQQAIQLMTGGSKSFLGVNVTEISSERSKELKLKEERGVEITSVQPDSPAEKAGLQKGDVVLEYQGQRVEGTEQFIRLVRETPIGRAAKLLVSRNGATQTIAATIGDRKGAVVAREAFRVIPPMEAPSVWFSDIPSTFTISRSPQLGMFSETLESQLAQFFGVKQGVLVRSVNKDSAAEKAGLKAGDVITKVEKTEVTSPREISSALRRLRSEKSVPLTVVREKKEITLSLTVEEENDRRSTTPRPGRMAGVYQEF